MRPLTQKQARSETYLMEVSRLHVTLKGFFRAITPLLWLLAPCPAWAGEPELVKDLGPADGEWQLDYTGQFGKSEPSGEGRRHSGQSFYGLSNAVAIGGETLLGYRRRRANGNARLFFDYDSVAAIIRFRPSLDNAFGAGVWLQAGLDEDGEVARIEARGIVEQRSRRWWVQGNLAVRRVNEGRAEGTHLAYAAQLSRALGRGVLAGLEASGQALVVSGFNRERTDKGQFLGPRLLSEFALGGRARGRLGLSYLRRLDTGGLRHSVQLSGGIRF